MSDYLSYQDQFGCERDLRKRTVFAAVACGAGSKARSRSDAQERDAYWVPPSPLSLFQTGRWHRGKRALGLHLALELGPKVLSGALLPARAALPPSQEVSQRLPALRARPQRTSRIPFSNLLSRSVRPRAPLEKKRG